MNFKDMWATDADGNQFVFTVEMQRELFNADLPLEPEALSQLPDTNSQKSKSNTKKQSKPSVAETSFEEPATIQIDPNTGKYIGRVKWFNAQKGFGFIARGGNEEIFFHRSNLDCSPESLQDGTWILYDVEETQKGFEAHEIELYDEN